MNKTYLMSGILILVLSAGLVSCSREEKVRDVFNAPTPIVTDEKGSRPLGTLIKQGQTTLDLQNEIDLGGGSPEKVEITSQCVVNEKELTQKFSFRRPAKLRVFQFLPDPILPLDLTKHKVLCAYHIESFNTVGSSRIFPTGPMTLSDRQTPGVLMEKNGSEAVDILWSKKLEGVIIRYRNTAAAAAQVVCEESRFHPLPFEQAKDLSHFDLGQPIEKSIRKRLQSCRILIAQEGQTEQIGPRFLLHLSPAPLRWRWDWPSPIEPPAEVVKGKIYGLGTLQIENKAGIARFVRIGKIAGTVQVKVMAQVDDGPIGRMSFALPWLSSSAIGADKGDHWLVKIEPSQTLLLPMFLRPPRQLNCVPSFMPTNQWSFAANATLTEVSDAGEVLDTLTASLATMAFDPNLIAAPAIEGACY